MSSLDLLPSWRDEFVLARDFRNSARRADLTAMIRARAVVRATRGVYRFANAVLPNDPDDAHLSRVRATALTMSAPLPFAQTSAAAIWGLPLIGPRPATVVVASRANERGRSSGLVVHSTAGGAAPTEWRGGLHVTSLARTAVDMARTSSLSQAVAICDAALRGQNETEWREFRPPVTKEELFEELAAFGRGRGTASARFAIEFADALSGSAGESVSRVGIHLLGFPRPELQVKFVDEQGLIGYVDFWWPKCRHIGEFDGRGKYLRDEFTNGRTTAEVVIDEKVREDRLRRRADGISRWDWPVARSLSLLRRTLVSAGLR
jgi:hypothetical protein